MQTLARLSLVLTGTLGGRLAQTVNGLTLGSGHRPFMAAPGVGPRCGRFSKALWKILRCGRAENRYLKSPVVKGMFSVSSD